jgi:anti-sigma factor RsiW
VICAEWHPDDERLLARYVDGAADPTLDAHLNWCQSCARRLSAMTRDLEDWHRAVADQADETFDERWMAAQRRGIQRRLGAMMPGRVLPFPVPGGAERHAPLARVAAAVLLVAMTGAGVFRILQMPDPVSSSARRTPARVVAPTSPVRETSTDAAVLEDIDLALVRPRTAVAELRALDEFTPHVRDIAAPRR